MANSDIRQFLQDCLIRYDPDIDLSEGSRADAEIVLPVVQRLGLDPFDTDIATFVRERVRQAFPNLAITEADELTDTVIDPMRVLIEPLVREVKLIKLRSSLRNVESLSDEEVDALLGNFFETRRGGGYAVGVVRLWFATPQGISISATNPAVTRSGLRFIPTRPQAITADQMFLNVEGSEYYFDVNYTAENRGDEYNVEPNEIVSVANLPTATRVRNMRRFRGGAPRETSIDYAARTQRGLSDKTLTVDRGVISTLTESFPSIRRIFTVGFRDPEMRRDVIRGGSLGPIPANDIYGAFYGAYSVADDLNADAVSPIIEAPTGNFVARLGAAGSSPDGWFLSLTYGSDVRDYQVLEVISSSQVRIDGELALSVTGTWALRERVLSISDIPGGITLPDTASGTLEIRKDEVHIGGKTDVYVAGETELATAQIDSLTDENPSARGINAQTQGASPGLEKEVILHDNAGTVTRGMSLVLEEGVDAGSYRILEVLVGLPLTIRVDIALTGSQGLLAWKVVDDIDVELTDPKDVKTSGVDLITAAGNSTVTTASATNFIDANIQEGDILEIFDEDFGGDFTVESVSAVNLTVTPAPQRTFGAVAYRVFRRSEAIDPPLVRVRSMELLDSAGAPSGTKIPYRDPVLAVANGFANEGSGFVFDGLVTVGLVTSRVLSGGTYAVGGATIEWALYHASSIWAGNFNAGVFTFSAGAKNAAAVATEINNDSALSDAGVRAIVFTRNGYDHVGIVAADHVRFEGGTALAALGFSNRASNAMIRSVDDPFSDAGVRTGDLIEVIDGNNSGVRGRAVVGPTSMGGLEALAVGVGPVGPEGANGAAGLYDNVTFRPDVGVRVRIGRPSVGTSRVYFLDPTSAEFAYASTVFSVDSGGRTLEYRPDPENTRVVRPAPPLTELPNTGETDAGANALTDNDTNFLLLGTQEGDLVDILYIPIDGTSALPTPGNVPFDTVLSNPTWNSRLRLRLDADPFITIDFPFAMPRQDVVDFINAQVGEDIASLTSGGALRLQSSRRIELDPTSSAIENLTNPLALAGAPMSSDHPAQGTYIVSVVAENVLFFSGMTPALTGGVVPDTAYRIRRYVQRISSTEMNQNRDVSGLYYADVELVSFGPGDGFNISAGTPLDVEGHRADGYRLVTESTVTSFSRAEVLHAEISRTILLPGSSDSPEEYVQLSQQNVQVTYDRSQLVDEVQSFCDSEFHRVVVQEILVRHLLPHYVSLAWSYAGGSAEPEMLRAFETALDKIEPNEQLEVTDLTDILRRRGATSVYTPDTSSTTGRTAPLFIVVYHDDERRVRGQLVRDFVTTVRTQRYIPDNIQLRRISAGGIR
jgi:hypothetical protein